MSNMYYENFIKSLSQETIYVGTRIVRLPESYFYAVDLLKEFPYQKYTAELVHHEDIDECSGNTWTVWKFTFPSGKTYTYSSLKEFPEETVFIKFYGFYKSHEGSEYQGWKEVSPATKEVVVYE